MRRGRPRKEPASAWHSGCPMCKRLKRWCKIHKAAAPAARSSPSHAPSGRRKTRSPPVHASASKLRDWSADSRRRRGVKRNLVTSTVGRSKRAGAVRQRSLSLGPHQQLATVTCSNLLCCVFLRKHAQAHLHIRHATKRASLRTTFEMFCRCAEPSHTRVLHTLCCNNRSGLR